MDSNVLLSALRAGRPVLGLAECYPASGIIEGMCKGWDFVWIDGQHGEHSYQSVLHALQAAAGIGIGSMVRVSGHDYGTLGRYADLVPSALMVPLVDTPEQARQLVQALRFPPQGNRSFGGRRACDLYGREYIRDTELMVVAQIESVEAVENVDAIAAVDGIDCLFFGPDDMKLRMNIPIETPVAESRRLLDAMARTAQAAQEAGIFAGCICTDAESLSAALQLGYRLIVGGSDIGFLRNGSAAKLEELRAALPGSTGENTPC